jgi:hypothetical protein
VFRSTADDAVLVAVELVLEGGRPSADHALNVIARLTDGPPVPSVATALTVAAAPAAWRINRWTRTSSSSTSWANLPFSQ